VVARLATLQEIETHWSLLDLLDAHDVLDAKEKAEKNQIEKIKRANSKKGRS